MESQQNLKEEERLQETATSIKTQKEPRYKLYIVISSCIMVVSIIILSLAGPQIICDSMNCIVYAFFGGLLLIASMFSNITLGIRIYQKRRTDSENLRNEPPPS